MITHAATCASIFDSFSCCLQICGIHIVAGTILWCVLFFFVSKNTSVPDKEGIRKQYRRLSKALSFRHWNRLPNSGRISWRDTDTPEVVCPGAGMFGFWQIGVVAYMKSQNYDLSKCSVVGASAGTLTCLVTLLPDKDPEDLIHVFLEKCRSHNIWSNGHGVVGIFSQIVQETLQDVLDKESEEKLVQSSKGRVAMLVTPAGNFLKAKARKPEVCRSFKSRQSIQNCILASCHVPLVTSYNKITHTFRGNEYMDGSFFAQLHDYRQRQGTVVVLDRSRDPVIGNRPLQDCVQAFSEDEIWQLYRLGRAFGEYMEENGEFLGFPKKVVQNEDK